jgi:hypothetical protein
MVITVHIDRWDVSKVLIDNGSQAKILFLSLKKWVLTENSSKNRRSPSVASVGKEWNQSGSSPYLCRSTPPKNARTEYITFDIVDMLYRCNAIFGRGLLNTFEAALQWSYLCLKISVTFDVISVFYSQQDARNIEKGFSPDHKNVHFCGKSQSSTTPSPVPVKQKL